MVEQVFRMSTPTGHGGLEPGILVPHRGRGTGQLCRSSSDSATLSSATSPPAIIAASRSSPRALGFPLFISSARDEDVAPLTTPVLKVADHQVAGHRFEDGRVGSLIDDSGRFYKPLQDGDRGEQEVSFYNRFWSDPNVPPSVQKFFPKFYGTIEIEAPNGAGKVRHAIMEDLTHGFQCPNIIDVKMGARTWYLEAGPKYVEKCKLKDKETTSEALGFRVSGMQVCEAKKGGLWKASRTWCKYMKPEEVPEALKRFVSSNPSAEKGYDGAFRKAVYGVALKELQDLKAWLEVQTSYHFFSASVLLVYEGEPTIPKAVSVRLVDFAHVLYDRDAIDENQLSGLNALMKMLTEIINSDTKVDT